MNLSTRSADDSRDTMDLAMKIVQEHCGKYMKVYANCVERFPDTWHLDCEVPRVKLAACADGNPLVVKIKNRCSDIYEDYEKCLVKNPIHVQHCTDQLYRFNECAREVTVKATNSS